MVSTRPTKANRAPRREGRGATPATHPETVRSYYERGGAIPTVRAPERVEPLRLAIAEVAVEVVEELARPNPGATRVASLLHLAQRMATEYQFHRFNPLVMSLKELERT